MSRRFHWRFFLLRWHRRVGVVLAVFLIWMAGSGVALNHAGDWGLDREMLQSPFWLQRYGVTPPVMLDLGERRLVLTSAGLLDGRQPLGECVRLLGVARLETQVVVACDSRVLLFTRQGELVEQMDIRRGLPGPFLGMAVVGEQIFLQRARDVMRLDLLDLSAQAAQPDAVPLEAWQASVEAPAGISRERLMQDLHSGRLLGAWGPWLVDLLALAVTVLALSGWALARKRHHKM